MTHRIHSRTQVDHQHHAQKHAKAVKNPEKDVTVAQGDTLWKIAKKHLDPTGKQKISEPQIARHLEEIKKLNPGISGADRRHGEVLVVGDELKLPATQWSVRPSPTSGKAAPLDTAQLKTQKSNEVQGVKDRLDDPEPLTQAEAINSRYTLKEAKKVDPALVPVELEQRLEGRIASETTAPADAATPVDSAADATKSKTPPASAVADPEEVAEAKAELTKRKEELGTAEARLDTPGLDDEAVSTAEENARSARKNLDEATTKLDAARQARLGNATSARDLVAKELKDAKSAPELNATEAKIKTARVGRLETQLTEAQTELDAAQADVDGQASEVDATTEASSSSAADAPVESGDTEGPPQKVAGPPEDSHTDRDGEIGQWLRNRDNGLGTPGVKAPSDKEVHQYRAREATRARKFEDSLPPEQRDEVRQRQSQRDDEITAYLGNEANGLGTPGVTAPSDQEVHDYRARQAARAREFAGADAPDHSERDAEIRQWLHNEGNGLGTPGVKRPSDQEIFEYRERNGG